MLNTLENEKRLLFKFPERMDTYKSQEMEKELEARINESNKNIVFDLDDVKFVSSYFLRICMNTVKLVGYERLSLQNAKADIKKVFAIAGFDKHINIK